MYRWDIINHFITKYNYKSYLEIGYFKAWSFDNVKCDFKIAVDPNPSKTPEQESAPLQSIIVDPPHAIYKMTSDDFFSHPAIQRDFRDHKWDIIFIDGLHEARQVMRDITNSLKYLNEGGTIILHDCNPPTYQHVTTGDPGGNWNGNVYEAVMDFRDKYEGDYSFYCVDTDWGVGVIRKRDFCIDLFHPYTIGIRMAMPIDRFPTEWDFFDAARKEILSLISVEEFLKKEGVHATV
jgi:hypothetical protein